MADTISVEVAIGCEECGDDLEVDSIDGPVRYEHRAIIRVKPCKTCLQDAREAVFQKLLEAAPGKIAEGIRDRVFTEADVREILEDLRVEVTA